MSDVEIIFWMLGGIGAIFGGGFVSYTSLVQRIARLEVVFEIMGKEALKQLHSPDDHLEIDEVIDRYFDEHDLTKDEWLFMRQKMEDILSSSETSDREKHLAILGLGLALHKLQPYGLTGIVKKPIIKK